MLKIESIVLQDPTGQTYTINKDQLEFFHLIGGNDANLITTKVFNQHGESFVDSFMEAEETSLNFMIRTENMTPLEIEEARRSIINVCNPLKDLLQMKITLNSGKIYNRDIVITAAPLFPIGLENRNQTWQKVQIFFRALNPFYYADEEITEDFSNVIKQFEFPFFMDEADNKVMFGQFTAGSQTINVGQVDAPVKITIQGTCTNPKIENTTTGEYLQFNDLIMDSDDLLEINTAFGAKTITLNGTNIFNKLDFSSTFFHLTIGENTIKFTDDTQSTDVRVIFSYRNLFINI